MLKLHFLCNIWVEGIISNCFLNLKLLVKSLFKRAIQKNTVLVQTANWIITGSFKQSNHFWYFGIDIFICCFSVYSCLKSSCSGIPEIHISYIKKHLKI